MKMRPFPSRGFKMSYRYLEDIAIADIAFEARGETLATLFIAAAEATMNVMVEALDTIRATEQRDISLMAESVEMLLFDMIQELIYYKDAEQLLLRIRDPTIKKRRGIWVLTAIARGERIDSGKHRLNVDVKAVTLHRLAVKNIPEGWKATVVLDI